MTWLIGCLLRRSNGISLANAGFAAPPTSPWLERIPLRSSQAGGPEQFLCWHFRVSDEWQLCSSSFTAEVEGIFSLKEETSTTPCAFLGAKAVFPLLLIVDLTGGS